MAKDYGVWLSYNNQEEGFELPILPSEIGSSSSGDGSEYEVYGLGKINAIRAPKLATFSVSSFFPAQTYAAIITAEQVFEPRYYIDLIEKWRQTKRPIRFVYVGSTMTINLPVSIESFEWQEVAGSPGDIQYSLELQEYRFYAAQKVDVKQNTSGSNATTVQKQLAARASDTETPKTYTIVSGDTLIKIAKKVYGKDTRWKEIQTYNSLSDAQLKQLKIGQILKIPA